MTLKIAHTTAAMRRLSWHTVHVVGQLQMWSVRPARAYPSPNKASMRYSQNQLPLDSDCSDNSQAGRTSIFANLPTASTDTDKIPRAG